MHAPFVQPVVQDMQAAPPVPHWLVVCSASGRQLPLEVQHPLPHVAPLQAVLQANAQVPSGQRVKPELHVEVQVPLAVEHTAVALVGAEHVTGVLHWPPVHVWTALVP